MAVGASEDPGRIARNAYTYLHVLIVAGIIATAAGDNLLVKDPGGEQQGVALAVILGGPALFLIAEALFEWTTTHKANVKRAAAAGLIVGLTPLASHLSALALAALITALLGALCVWEGQPRHRFGWASAGDPASV